MNSFVSDMLSSKLAELYVDVKLIRWALKFKTIFRSWRRKRRVHVHEAKIKRLHQNCECYLEPCFLILYSPWTERYCFNEPLVNRSYTVFLILLKWHNRIASLELNHPFIPYIFSIHTYTFIPLWRSTNLLHVTDYIDRIGLTVRGFALFAFKCSLLHIWQQKFESWTCTSASGTSNRLTVTPPGMAFWNIWMQLLHVMKFFPHI